MRKILPVLVASVILCDRLFADDTNLPTLIVAPFSGDTTAISLWQPAVGQGLSEMLVTELNKINKFQVLENSELGELKNEINMGGDGWVDKEQKVDKGGFAAADFMFVGKVTRFGSKEQKFGLGGFAPGGLGALGLKRGVSDVRIDWRLVDVATRKIIKSDSAVAQQTGLGFLVGVGTGGGGGIIGFDNKEFMDSALGKATVKAMSNIVVAVQEISLPESGRAKQKSAVAEAVKHTPGKVIAVAGKETIIISLGTKEGLKDGDKLNLYQTSDVKDDKGNVVFTDEKLVGEITITSAQEDRSRASCSGELNVQQGWTVKAK
jgi:curli biogenesis system outer membrane secretion channel CsgG